MPRLAGSGGAQCGSGGRGEGLFAMQPYGCLLWCAEAGDKLSEVGMENEREWVLILTHYSAASLVAHGRHGFHFAPSSSSSTTLHSASTRYSASRPRLLPPLTYLHPPTPTSLPPSSPRQPLVPCSICHPYVPRTRETTLRRRPRRPYHSSRRGQQRRANLERDPRQWPRGLSSRGEKLSET